MSVAVINAMTKTQLRRGNGLLQFRNWSASSARARGQGRNLHARTKVETIKEFCLLTCCSLRFLCGQNFHFHRTTCPGRDWALISIQGSTDTSVSQSDLGNHIAETPLENAEVRSLTVKLTEFFGVD